MKSIILMSNEIVIFCFLIISFFFLESIKKNKFLIINCIIKNIKIKLVRNLYIFKSFNFYIKKLNKF